MITIKERDLLINRAARGESEVAEAAVRACTVLMELKKPLDPYLLSIACFEAITTKEDVTYNDIVYLRDLCEHFPNVRIFSLLLRLAGLPFFARVEARKLAASESMKAEIEAVPS